ncbi:MAG: RNA polymerase sigma-70 factor [Bacteroidetes bacterium]|nr:RNA polymerase sigma-70 factor [Bacteroidota bacterium]
MPIPNENNLLARIAEGDEKAFGVLFHHYRERIYSYAYHLSGNNAQADELVQDVFLKVWLNREKIPHVLRFDSWLFTIARNQIFDLLKNMAKEASLRRQIAELLSVSDNPVEDHILSRENEEQLQRALDQLSPRQKLIFTLSRNQGMKHEEIASRLHISRHTVKTHLVQALKTLRDTLHFQSDRLLIFIFLFTQIFLD